MRKKGRRKLKDKKRKLTGGDVISWESDCYCHNTNNAQGAQKERTEGGCLGKSEREREKGREGDGGVCVG